MQTYSKDAANVARLFSGDATPKEVSTAIRGHIEQIRHYTPEQQDNLLMAEITKLANEYGARQDINDDVLNEAIDFVIASFPWLGVRELRTAFRWHASGKIKTAAGEIYGGVFSVRALGAILTEYNELRKKIVAQYVDAVTKKEAEEAEEARKAKQKDDFEKNLLESVKRARVQKLPWNSIPAAWHDWLLERGKLEYTDDEKRQAWNDAAEELEREKAEERKDAMAGSKINRVVALKAIGRQDDENRRVIIAKKLLVYRKLIR